MDPALALTAPQKGAILLLVTGVAAPIAGAWFARSAGAWRTIGRGPFSIEREEPPPRGGTRAQQGADPAIQAAEVRQMLEARDARRRRRGESPIDVEAEASRLLAEQGSRPGLEERMAADLRAEVRGLVVARNERRRRQGLPPLDVEAETDRQLADLVGSR